MKLCITRPFYQNTRTSMRARRSGVSPKRLFKILIALVVIRLLLVAMGKYLMSSFAVNNFLISAFYAEKVLTLRRLDPIFSA
jgi:hypothetical protein